MYIITCIIFGLIIGSFLSVCIYRIPLGRPKGLDAFNEDDSSKDISSTENAEYNNVSAEQNQITIAKPSRSFCPNCKEQLLWWHNIPTISWIILGGKCYFCKAHIPFRYPLVEMLSALFCVLSYSYFDIPTASLIYIYCASLIVLSFIDIDYYILPNVINYPSTIIALIIAGINHFYGVFTWPIVPDLWQSGFGLLAGAGVLLLVSETYYLIRKKIGLGLGDVKLLAVTGLLLGPEAAFATIFAGAFLGVIIGALLLILARHSFQRPLPFGPYLAFGTVLYIFTGPGFPQNLTIHFSGFVLYIINNFL